VKKGLKITIALALCLAVASPALAEIKLDGFYRLQGISQTHLSGDAGSGFKSTDPHAQTMIDQRLRLRLINTVNEWVSVVYFAEIDAPFGEQSRGQIGGGGKVGADGVNIETKNFYLDLKLPDTTMAMRAGIQWWTDSYDNVVVADDMAAVLLTGKLGAATDYHLLYSKWDEGTGFSFAGRSGRNFWNDTDFYVAGITHKVNDSFKGGATVYFFDDNTDTSDNLTDFDTRELFYYGLHADYRFRDFGVRGWALLQDGEFENNTTGEKVDSTSLATSVKGSMVIPQGDVGLRVTYVTDDDDDKDNNAFVGGQGTTEFSSDGLMIFYEDPLVLNSGTSRFAFADAAGRGFGLFAVNAMANLKKGLPMGLYANLAAGAFWSLTDDASDDNVDVREGKTLGYEVAARVGKVFAEKVDVSARVAYAAFGDFYDDTARDDKGQGDLGDPDDVYKAVLMVNVPF
jgi:hypothetical protein